MDDLISRQAAIDEAEEWIEAVYCDREEQRERSAIKKVIQGIKALPSVQLAADTNVGTKLSTNLAGVGTDCISKKQVIDALEKWLHGLFGITEADGTATIFKTIRQLPPIQPKLLQPWEVLVAQAVLPQPEIVRCKDCAKHNKGLGNYEVHPDGSSTWIWKDSACPPLYHGEAKHKGMNTTISTAFMRRRG